MEQTKTEEFTTHLPQPMAEKIDRLAARIDRPRSWVIHQALLAWIELEEQHTRLTEEALADVDAGRVLDHETVQSWAGSLNSDT